MAINFNTGPYYDDYDPAKGFYKVLFKPGYAVQARELNQLQSILQHQISRVGNHLFKKNSMVIPGGISLNTRADIVSVDDISDPAILVGTTITNAPTFDYTDDATLDNYITAIVLSYAPATTTFPAALYVKYLKPQADGRAKFEISEPLKTVGSTLIQFKVHDTLGASIGKVATISDGTFYTKEMFVDVFNQSLIISRDEKDILFANVGLQIVEELVTSDSDESLLDNSIGTPNQYAPGADRYQVMLFLVSYDKNTMVENENFIKLIEIENNVITYINNKTQYAELMKMLARRTYDANGNFIVSGLEVAITESADSEYLQANIGTGKCYLGGYEYDQIVKKIIAIPKPRDIAHQQDVPTISTYNSGMDFFYIAGGDYLKEIPDANSLIHILDSSPAKVEFQASNNTALIDSSTNTFAITDHGLYTSAPVKYTATTSVLQGGTSTAITVQSTSNLVTVNENLFASSWVGSALFTETDEYIGSVSEYVNQTTVKLRKVAAVSYTGKFKKAQAIGGLIDGETYYVLKLNDNSFQLCHSPVSTALTSSVVSFTGTTSTIDLVTDTFTSTNHGFNLGTIVTYTSSGTVAAGLTANQRYYVIVDSPNTFRLSRTIEGAISSRVVITFNPTTTVNINTEIFTIENHGYTTGVDLTYRKGGTSDQVIGGLTNEAVYYVIKIDDNNFKLASTYANATQATPVAVNLSSGATGTTHSFSRAVNVTTRGTGTHSFSRAVDIDETTLDGSSTTHVLKKDVFVIGYGVFKYIEYHGGNLNDTDVYKIYLDYLTLENGIPPTSIGGFRVVGKDEGAPILHKLDIGDVVGEFVPGQQLLSASNSSQSGIIYSTLGSSLYVIKDGGADVPSTDVVIQTSPSASATRRSAFITEFGGQNFVPMIKVHNDVIKTLYYNNQPSVSYSVIRKDIFNITGSGEYATPYTLGDNQTFEDFSTSDFFAFIVDQGSEQFVDLTDVLQLTNAGKGYLLRITDQSPMLNKTVWVYSTIEQTNVVQANKTQTLLTNGFTIPNPSASWMALGHQDIVQVTKVVDGKVISLLAPDETNPADEGGAVYDATTGEIIFTTEVNHALAVGNTVVIKNVYSSVNTTGEYNKGYNGKYTIKTVSTDGLSFRVDTEIVSAGNFVVGNQYSISSQGTSDFTQYGAANNTVGTTFTATSAGWGTGTARRIPGVLQTQGVVALPPDINNDVDITSRFYCDTGASETYISTSLIKLKKGATLPSGQISVQYQYYLTGSGDYVSVDSYGNYNGDLDYIGQIPDIIGTSKNVISLRNYIDFRSTTSKYFFKNIGIIGTGSNILSLRDLNLTGLESLLIGKYVLGLSHNKDKVEITGVRFNSGTGNTELVLKYPSTGNHVGVYFIGLLGEGLNLVDPGAGGKSFLFPKNGARISYRYTKFTPKQVMIYINRSEDVLTVEHVEVKNISEVVALRRNEFKLPLAHVYMQPYTNTLHDINITKFENPVYQMLDIHNLKLKIDRLEYYTLKQGDEDIHQAVIDANNENVDQGGRGFWNEDFQDVNNQPISDDDFQSTIYDKQYVAPGTVTRVINLEHDSTQNATTWVRTGEALTLPYKEVKAFGNPLASKSNNLNPFNVVEWKGKLNLNPSVDNWVDTTVAPTLTSVNTITIPATTINNITNTTTTTNNTTNTTNNTTINNTTNNVGEVTSVKTQPIPPAAAETPSKPANPVLPPVLPPPVVVAPVATAPAPVIPPPPIDEIVTHVDIIQSKWGPDTWGGYHAITFSWKTNLNRTGRVNTDVHLVTDMKKKYNNEDSYNGKYALSLIGKRYDTVGVKDYLNIGTHFDQKSVKEWAAPSIPVSGPSIGASIVAIGNLAVNVASISAANAAVVKP